MATAILSQYTVNPGRRDDFLQLLAATKTHLDGLGGDTRLRTTVIGGETSGRIGMTSMFDDAEQRAAFMDKVLEDLANNPMQDALNVENPPATLLSRSLLQSTDPAAPIPPDLRVLQAMLLRAAPGRRDEALAALDEAEERQRAVGASVARWVLTSAGSNQGVIAVGVSADSFAELQELTAKAFSPAEPNPIRLAVAAGSITPVSAATSVRIDT